MLIEEELSSQIISAFYKVYNATGHGFLEMLYQRCLVIALRRAGLVVETELPISMRYDDEPVGDYRLDLVVNRRIIVECKSGDRMLPVHEHQLMNYLAATGIEVGLLFNFGARPTFKRLVYEHSKKSRPRHLSIVWKSSPI
ncbi:MAG: GxxExxY protein [Gemmatimonas sp.]